MQSNITRSQSIKDGELNNYTIEAKYLTTKITKLEAKKKGKENPQ